MSGSGQQGELVRAAFWKAAGVVLQQLRERRGWSRAEAAERAGVTEDLVVAYELARVRYPELEACWRLTAALGVALPAFLAAAERRAGVSLLAGAHRLADPAAAVAAPADSGEQVALADFIRQGTGVAR
jgi:transcriptional regulator with XRE-family HTH domain